MRRLVSALVLSMALAAPAFADTVTPSPAPEPVKARAKDKGGKAPGVVCTSEIPTGSRFPVKVCTTPEQRRGQSKDAQNAQERMQGSGAPVTPN